MKVVCVEGVSLVIKGTTILSNISLEMDEGMIYGLVGRNGSGKTMLMKCICGFVKPTFGEIYVWGELRNDKTDFPDNMGIIIETPGFIPYYSGYRNLKILAAINNRITQNDITESMRYVGLNPNSKKRVSKYSLGMRQRLGLAQAIMEKPDLLILDEPFNGLDAEGVQDMRKYLLELKAAGKTILLASHSTEDIAILCDAVYEMNRGKLVQETDKIILQ